MSASPLYSGRDTRALPALQLREEPRQKGNRRKGAGGGRWRGGLQNPWEGGTQGSVFDVHSGGGGTRIPRPRSRLPPGFDGTDSPPGLPMVQILSHR